MGTTQQARLIAPDDRTAIGVLTLFWLIAVAVVGVQGDFPLNDDWAYARMVKTFLDSGEIAPTSWTFTPTISNVWLGAAFSKLLGFSHETLRLSMLCVGWGGMLGAFVLARTSALSSIPACLVAAAYGFNPLHLSLSFSFMTDVAFACFYTWATVGVSLYFGGKRGVGVAVFVLACGLALLSRQPAAVLPVAFLSAVVLSRAQNLRQLFTLVAGGALAVLVLFVTLKRVPSFNSVALLALLALDDPSLPFYVVVNSSTLFTVLGLLIFPVVPLLWSRTRSNWLTLTLWLGLSMGVCLVLFRFERLIPSTRVGQLLGARGLGVVTLHASDLRRALPPPLIALCTVLGATSMAWGTARALQGVARIARRSPAGCSLDVFLLLAVVLYLIPPCIRGHVFDRYSLPVVAPLLVLFARQGPQLSLQDPRVLSSACTLLLVGLLSTLATLDYLTLLRAEDALVRVALTTRRASPRELQGGFSYDGYLRYDVIEPIAQIRADAQVTGLPLPADWFSLNVRTRARDYSFTEYPLNDRFLVSLSPHVQNFRLLEERPARSILSQASTVRLFERVAPEPPLTPDALIEKLYGPRR